MKFYRLVPFALAGMLAVLALDLRPAQAHSPSFRFGPSWWHGGASSVAEFGAYFTAGHTLASAHIRANIGVDYVEKDCTACTADAVSKGYWPIPIGTPFVLQISGTFTLDDYSNGDHVWKGTDQNCTGYGGKTLQCQNTYAGIAYVTGPVEPPVDGAAASGDLVRRNVGGSVGEVIGDSIGSPHIGHLLFCDGSDAENQCGDEQPPLAPCSGPILREWCDSLYEKLSL